MLIMLVVAAVNDHGRFLKTRDAKTIGFHIEHRQFDHFWMMFGSDLRTCPYWPM